MSVGHGDAEVVGQVRGQGDELDAVDGDAAQRLVPGGYAELGAPQVHLGAACLREVRTGQAAPAEADPEQRGATEVHVAQHAVLEGHVGEHGGAEVHRVELAVAERDAAQRGREGLYPGQRAAGQGRVLPAGFGQVGGHEPAVPQRHVGEPALAQPPPTERGADERTVQEVAAPCGGLVKRGVGEAQALVVLVRLQIAREPDALRHAVDSSAGPRPRQRTRRISGSAGAPREIHVVLRDPVA
jgi:hypothetical protein